MECLSVLFINLVILASTKAVNPGLRLRITQDGLHYANKVAVDTFAKDIKRTRLEDITGNVKGVKYSLTNLIVNDFKAPKSAITLASGSDVEWRATKIGLEIDGTFEYIFLFIKGGGDFTVKASDLSFAVGIQIGVDTNGKPTIKTTSCDCKIGPLKIKFRGKRAWIYNILTTLASNAIATMLQKKVCEKVKDVLDKKAEEELCSFQAEIQLGEHLTLDYRLLSAPHITSEYIEGDFKGEVFWTMNRTEAPFTPAPMASITDNKKMAYLTVSNYIFNSMGYQAYAHGLLIYNLTSQKMRDKNDLLNTTCDDACIGKLIPQIGQLYPNCHVEIHLQSTDWPRVFITEKAVQILSKNNVTFSARKPDNTLHFMFRIHAVTMASVKINLNGDALSGTIDYMKVETNVTNSLIGDIDETTFQLLVDDAVKKVIKPMINDYLKDVGIQLPSTDNLQFKDAKIEFLRNTILVETNVKITPNIKKKKSTVLKYKPMVGRQNIKDRFRL
ncbi:LBP [Mytilus coruscus]|uniref:LBP n=1 Tax=Mytilus coruscus TaxID=42192 RepID=A0A6J8C6N4_MYTCO|nr:LBP [Mytilus coruscus]